MQTILSDLAILLLASILLVNPNTKGISLITVGLILEVTFCFLVVDIAKFFRRK